MGEVLQETLVLDKSSTSSSSSTKFPFRWRKLLMVSRLMLDSSLKHDALYTILHLNLCQTFPATPGFNEGLRVPSRRSHSHFKNLGRLGSGDAKKLGAQECQQAFNRFQYQSCISKTTREFFFVGKHVLVTINPHYHTRGVHYIVRQFPLWWSSLHVGSTLCTQI